MRENFGSASTFLPVFACAISFFPFLLPSLSGAEEDSQNEDLWQAESPDKNFIAAARRMPDDGAVWKREFDGFWFVVYSQDEQIWPKDHYAKHDFVLRLPVHIQWSPDSKFVVFTTRSSGGHSPWHWKAFVFAVRDKSYRSLDDAIGAVVSPEFHFETPNTAVMRVEKFGKEEKRKVPLGSRYEKIPRVKP